MTRDDAALFDLLLQRLLWPSLVVRERAAVAAATLLSHKEYAKEATEALLAWMANQGFESTAIVGLLVLAQLKIQGGSLPTWAAVSEAVRKPSLLSCLVARELYGEDASDPELYEFHTGTAPRGFVEAPFFRRYAKILIPPIFIQRARTIDEESQGGFLKQWAFEWTRLVDRMGIKLSRPSEYFWSSPDRDHVVVWDLPLSEAYRSSFLRALAWAVSKRIISRGAGVLFGISSMKGGTLTSLYDFSLDKVSFPVLRSNG